MSIDCTDPIQFPPIVSNPPIQVPNNQASSSVSSSTTVVVGGPDCEQVQKTADVNQLVGIPPYDLDSLAPTEEWVNQTTRRGKQPLATIPEEPSDLLQFSDEDVKEELEYWKNSVYGFILGANPPVEVVEGFLKRLWSNYPIDKISFCANGVFLVRFRTNQARHKILQQGHFLFDNKPLIVRPWDEGVAMEKEDIKEVPVWVKIFNLPLKFWGKCLPRIAGIMGKFVRCDDATQGKTRLSFARVMIDVPFGHPIPEAVKFRDVDGSTISLKVEFEWKPLLCTQCQGVGHEAAKCRKGKKDGKKDIPQKTVNAVRKKQWRPKQTQKPAVTVTVVSPPPNTQEDIPVSTPFEKPNNFEVSWSRNGKYHMADTPAHKIIRLSRQEIVETGHQAMQFGSHNLLETMNNLTPKVGIGTIGSLLPPDGGLFGLLETKVKPLSLNAVKNNFCNSWCITTNTHLHHGGRVWIIWNPAMFNVQILLYDAQFIHLVAMDVESKSQFTLTVVYACNGTQERKKLWVKLSQIKIQIQVPWVICGDFNTVLSPNERLGGHSTEEEIDDFKQCVDECEVMDCPASGSLYTWCNKQDPTTRVYSRLDRVLVNQMWLTANPLAYAHFYCEGTFDHTPCVVQEQCDGPKKRRSFKYLNMWSQSVDFKSCVQEHWSKYWPGTKMYQLVHKLKNLKGPLKSLNRNDFDDIENNAARARMYLESIQEKLRIDPNNPDLIHMEIEAASSVRFLEDACYTFLVQKSKVTWVDKGDSNNRYFHSVIKTRQVRSKIMKIEDTKGVLCEDISQIQSAFIGFYTDLLGT
ncbi:uncharacterized protein LOC141632336 [Silene latifolia]|uniref:uncharacterized protein LOC141632336 n=1 Tax=Silene latifolia TaxID=37657 RepID=UPI003D770563